MVEKVKEVGDQDELNSMDALPRESIRARISALISDIQEMRPFLVRNFNSTKTMVGLGGGFCLAWDWTTRFGIANVMGSESEREVRQALNSKRSAYLAVIDYSGRMVDPTRPWSTGIYGNQDPKLGLSESLFVLGLFHERLWGFYNKLDFDAIRKIGSEKTTVEADSEEVPDEVFALSCQDVAERLEPTELEFPHRTSHRARMLRFKPLVSYLERSFDCEIRRGKGSEIVVYRHSAKPYRLPHHTQNPEIPAMTIRNMLRRLEISESDWFREVYRTN
jgi:hypothetical protein